MLTIKLDNDQINLTSTFFITYDKTNLPKQSFKFKTHEPLYWKVEEKHYDFETGTLIVNIVDYNSVPDDSFYNQESKYSIKSLKFEKLDWKKFEPLLFTYTLKEIKKIVFNYSDRVLYLREDDNEDVKSLKRNAPNLFFGKREPIHSQKEIEVRVKYEDAKFDDSKITFTVNIKSLNFTRQLEIINPNFRQEFEYIKPYFAKRLGKSFLVKIKFSFLDEQVQQIDITSDDINNIDEKFIALIKDESILNLRHFRKEQENRILYDVQELAEIDSKLSLFNTTATDILEVLIAKGNIRNVKQLEYLAKDKQSLNERISFTLKPMFGFVFNVTNNNHCFIWELLDSHATYIWKSNSSQNKLELSKIVEEAIASIKIDGRESYKKYYNSLELPLYSFKVITHPSNNLTDEERFIEWKNRLQSIVDTE